jgi:uncharacterized protein (TIGR04168 family)
MRIAVIGDVHGLFDVVDVRQLDDAGYDLVLFVGDLPRSRAHRDTLQVARRISELRTPAILIPGNHDGTHPVDVAEEALGLGRWLNRRGARQAQRVGLLAAALGPVRLGGYSLHRFPQLSVLVARPHAMDARALCFPGYQAETFGVRTLEESAARLKSLVDESSPDPLVFLAHNGPVGFGSAPVDPWALRKLGRDNGDRDLAEAVVYAQETGRLRAVVAGHMHHQGERRWLMRHNGVLFINPARVPRIFERNGRRLHHHVALSVEGGGAQAREVLWDEA